MKCMKFFKTKKGKIITVLVILLTILIIRHIIAENTVYYKPTYEKADISDTLSNETLEDKDYMLIYKQTGVSPGAAKEIMESGDTELLSELNELYFKEAPSKKNYIAYPITLEERNNSQITPLVPLKKGDILATFNTRTFDWRHGHLGLVVDDSGTVALEHMAIGQVSCTTSAFRWGKYPAFVVLRYSDPEVAAKAADYAGKNLVGIPYSIVAGIIDKDKTGEVNPSSHCSHIVWQAYKSQGVDIDVDGGPIVTPHDVAMSEKLSVVQIFGTDPEDYEDRLLK